MFDTFSCTCHVEYFLSSGNIEHEDIFSFCFGASQPKNNYWLVIFKGCTFVSVNVEIKRDSYCSRNECNAQCFMSRAILPNIADAIYEHKVVLMLCRKSEI